MKKYVWTPEKLKILQDFYCSHGGAWIKKNYLYDASINSIFYKAKSLGLKKLGKVTDVWSEEDLFYIKNAADYTIQEICESLPKFNRDSITAKLREYKTKSNESKYKCGVYIIGWDNYVYVGQTVHLNRRITEHNKNLRLGTHFNKKLQLKYLEYNTYPEIIEFVPCCKDDLREVELWNIEIYRRKGYEVLNTSGNL